MASPTSSQGRLEGLSPVQLLVDMTIAQLKRSEQLTRKPIKERLGHGLSVSQIMCRSARVSTHFGEKRLKQFLEDCRDGDGADFRLSKQID